MTKKRFNANRYMETKLKWGSDKISVISDPNDYLFAYGKYRTKILAKDLPEWYVYGYMYKRHGYLSAKGVKHLLYTPNYFIENHWHKYDTLYISYDAEIEPYTDERGMTYQKGYDEAIGGHLIVEFVEAVSKHTDYDVSEIQQELDKKRAWYFERNPKF
jgi:hypothetical protein